MALFNYSYYIICFSFWYKIFCSSGCLKLAMYLKWAMYSIFHFWCAWDYSPYVCFLINTYLMLCHASDKTWYCWLKNNHKTNIIKNLKFLKKTLPSDGFYLIPFKPMQINSVLRAYKISYRLYNLHERLI